MSGSKRGRGPANGPPKAPIGPGISAARAPVITAEILKNLASESGNKIRVDREILADVHAECRILDPENEGHRRKFAADSRKRIADWSDSLLIDGLAELATQVLRDAAHIAIREEPDSPAERRDWCRSVAKSARNLAELLAGRDDPTGSVASPRAALHNLSLGAPPAAEVDTDEVMRVREPFWREKADVHHWLTVAVPSLPALTDNHASQILLGRMPSSLQAVAAIADSAANSWADQVKKGGSTEDRARIFLMERLCLIYEPMFGRSATVSTIFRKTDHAEYFDRNGLAIRWFKALFQYLGDVLEQEIGRDPEDMGLLTLARIANEALKSKRDDVLAGWIRDARSNQQK
jgi:hypothetical protein